MIARESKRIKMSHSGKVKRCQLSDVLKNTDVTYDDKMAAMVKLNKRPRDESLTRVQRRCRSCGRTHAVYRKFALCRICLRQAAMRGDVPGLLKASW